MMKTVILASVVILSVLFAVCSIRTSVSVSPKTFAPFPLDESLKFPLRKRHPAPILRREGCTAFLATPGATASGKEVLLAQTVDMIPPGDVRVGFTPAADHPTGSRRAIYRYGESYPRIVRTDSDAMYRPRKDENVSIPIGYIPQVETKNWLNQSQRIA